MAAKQNFYHHKSIHCKYEQKYIEINTLLKKIKVHRKFLIILVSNLVNVWSGCMIVGRVLLMLTYNANLAKIHGLSF